MVKKRLLLLLKCLGIIAVCAAVGLALLLAVYTLPTEPMQAHIRDTLDIFLDEGDYPRPHSWTKMWRDNFTDNIMLGNAAYGGDEPLLDKALSVYRTSVSYEGDNMMPSYALVAAYNDGLADFSGDESALVFARDDYARYWHGYLVFLKPLLSIMNYGNIRVLNGILQTALLLVALFMMWSRKQKGLIVPFILVWGTLIPTDTAACMQYSDIYYIYTIGTIVLIALYGKDTKRPLDADAFAFLFLALGIATSFFDFLTYPLVSLAVPLGAYLYIRLSAEPDTIGTGNPGLRGDLLSMVWLSFLWGLGYVGMWACKWLLAIVFAGQGMGKSGVAQSIASSIHYRMSSVTDQGKHISVFSTITSVFPVIINNPFFIASLVYIAILIALCFVFKKWSMRRGIVYALLAVYPFAWYAVVVNHSYVHYWFTYKELVITTFALMLMFTFGYEWFGKKRKAKPSKK